MKNLRVTFFFLAVALTLSGCGIFGGSDGTDVSVAESVAAQPTVNNVQAVPAQTPDGSTADDATDSNGQAEPTAAANAALPTAVTLPTAAPTPEPTVDRSQPTTYVVQSGDVLGLIAERFDADIAELRRVNGLDGNLIRVGQELTIPALDGSTTTESADAAPESTSAPASPAATTAPAAPVSCSGSTASGHCVQPGESLLGIALKYDVEVEALRAANPGIDGDLIKSGEVINLPGGAAPAPVATTAPVASGTSTPVPTAAPVNDADCAARNPEFPFFHAADGLCYANPIDGNSGTPTATTIPGSDPDQDCAAGFFLWEDGLCYPIPGVTVTPDADATPTATVGLVSQDFGRPPCRDGYVVLVETNRCWPEATNTSPATVTPVAGTTATTTAGTQTTCDGANFTRDATGKCFLTQDGADAGCSIENGTTPFCP